MLTNKAVIPAAGLGTRFLPATKAQPKEMIPVVDKPAIALRVSLKEQIQNDMKAALLSGNRFEGEVLRSLKAVVLNEEVSLGKREEGLDDSAIEKLIAKEVKKRQESIAIYRQNDRTDLAENEQREVEVLNQYLPKQLTEAELLELAKEVISQTGASNPQQMGQVIGAIKVKAGAAADGAMVAKIVKDLLTQ